MRRCCDRARTLNHPTGGSLAVAPDPNRCFTVLREPAFSASRFGPVNCRPLGRLMTISREALKSRIDADLALAHPDDRSVFARFSVEPELVPVIGDDRHEWVWVVARSEKARGRGLPARLRRIAR
jgi:hypothetical protein